MKGPAGKEDYHKSLPRSLQIWAQIEEKAQQRAEERFQEILKKTRACAGIASNQIAPKNGE